MGANYYDDSPEDVQAMRNLNRGYWDSVDRKTRDRHLAKSLQRLIYLHEYSDQDIGIMFGVSRERVRQWRRRYGFLLLNRKQKGTRYRIWNEGLGRFVAVLGGKNQVDVMRRKRKRKRKLETVRQQDVFQIQTTANRLGYVPGLAACGWKTNDRQIRLANRWGWKKDKSGLTYKQAWDLLWYAAGFQNRPSQVRGTLHGQQGYREI